MVVAWQDGKIISLTAFRSRALFTLKGMSIAVMNNLSLFLTRLVLTKFLLTLARSILKRFLSMIISHKSPDKKERFNDARDAQLKDGIDWNGYRFQVDERSQLRIARRALKLIKRQLLGESIEPFIWRTADNGFVTFSASEFLQFADAVDSHDEGIMAAAWAGKDTA
ncbi:protein of unknown function [Marinobacterium iners DSM 11526]|uniref:DUF4376 domain-containing protein n=2 Tax=Marinobacterium iners TaxID=48076 RepID=A0A1H3X676_9GAMM|nr:protein of unknown function [Marinobacterium iners DSM 11526]